MEIPSFEGSEVQICKGFKVQTEKEVREGILIHSTKNTKKMKGSFRATGMYDVAIKLSR